MIEPLVMKKIFRAFENKDISAINALILQQQVNPNILIPNKGVSLLHLIIGHQSENFAFKITKLFLRCGGDPNIPSQDGVTPTHVAAGWGRNRILHLLLVNGGDPWIQDDEKKNAFNYAFEEQEWSTIEMLHRFQQMHAAAASKQDLDPKFRFDLERILLHKGDETIAYAPVKPTGPHPLPTKSITTQTQYSVSNVPSSPVQDRIKYFELDKNTSTEENCWKKPEKLNIEWSKDLYQTSCEVMVHCNSKKESSSTMNEKPTFISSIHIDTSLKAPDSKVKKSKKNSSSADIRSQLFVELQEAVHRRSKLKMIQHNVKNNVKTASEISDESKSASIVILDSESVINNSSEKKNCEKPSLDIQGNSILKNMSDFASQVMKEINSCNIESSDTINLCMSSPEITNNHFSDEENISKKSDLKNIQTLIMPQSHSDSSTLYLTPYNSDLSGDIQNHNWKEDGSNASFVSVSEEYKYTDTDEGVILLEKKMLVTPTISVILESKHEEEETNENVSVTSSTCSSLPSGYSCDSDILRCQLRTLGYNPGPITTTTKKLYMKKLWRMKKQKKALENSVGVNFEKSSTLEYSKLVNSLILKKSIKEISSYRSLEDEMCRSFERWTKRKWREGNNKCSFNYLLLDPRISLNLPKRANDMTEMDAWKCFLSAVFYIGKGKRSRPYSHLYQAAAFWEKRTSNIDEKITRIIEIWNEGHGVVCLQVFQNIIPVEAFTREAAMIDALGLSNLKNAKAGEYYGIVSTWPKKDKINLGMYLLHKALLIFLNEGERQIKPYDIG